MTIKEIEKDLEIVLNALARVFGAVKSMSDAEPYYHAPAEPQGFVALQSGNQKGKDSLAFYKKEIKEMPRLKDFTLRLKNNKYFELRYRKDGYNMSFCSADFEEVKNKAYAWLDALEEPEPQEENTPTQDYFDETTLKTDMNFKEFADFYIYSVKKVRVKPTTFKSYKNTYEKFISPHFKAYPLRRIRPMMIQAFLDTYKNKIPRATEDLKILLNNIFDYALVNGLVALNPVKAVYLPKHVRKNGTALTLKEEAEFLRNVEGSQYEAVYLKMLYSGIRPCEVIGLKEDFTENTLTIKNGKLKSYQTNLTRTIPIFPLYHRFATRLPLKDSYSLNRVRDEFKKICPNHTLKDLRHTFTSRARECGIDNEVVAVWTGHSLGNITSSVYTHFSMEFQQEQAKKLNYVFPQIFPHSDFD